MFVNAHHLFRTYGKHSIDAPERETEHIAAAHRENEAAVMQEMSKVEPTLADRALHLIRSTPSYTSRDFGCERQ